MKLRKYIIKAPKYYCGQKVQYIGHKGNTSIGIINFIETHYSKEALENGKELHTAYHQYSIRLLEPTGRRQQYHCWWIGEDNIIRVLSQEAE
jgi:hypothetical protein